MREAAGEASAFLRALANESRLMILCHLAAKDGREMSVGELAKAMDLDQPRLSQHLARLRRDGLVKTRREAQTIYYSVARSEAAPVIEVLHNSFCPPQKARKKTSA